MLCCLQKNKNTHTPETGMRGKRDRAGEKRLESDCEEIKRKTLIDKDRGEGLKEQAGWCE